MTAPPSSATALAASRRGLLAWARRRSLRLGVWGAGCCAGAPGTDDGLADLGVDAGRSPADADVLLVFGRVSLKAIPALRDLHARLRPPRTVIAFGTCACSGGLFDTYAAVPGVDRCIPVDVYVPGCPPRAEDLVDALMLLRTGGD